MVCQSEFSLKENSLKVIIKTSANLRAKDEKILVYNSIKNSMKNVFLTLVMMKSQAMGKPTESLRVFTCEAELGLLLNHLLKGGKSLIFFSFLAAFCGKVSRGNFDE